MSFGRTRHFVIACAVHAETIKASPSEIIWIGSESLSGPDSAPSEYEGCESNGEYLIDRSVKSRVSMPRRRRNWWPL